jgi:muramoyltetrapeptide carboxypeptidase
MASAFNGGGYKNKYVQSIKAAVEGIKADYSCKTHKLNHTGTATAELVGGNLALIAHLIGTKSDYQTKGKILFIEDVGEQHYNVDRMLHQLKRSGKLEALAGLIIGGFTDMQDTERPFGKKVYDLIHDLISEYKYPICFGFPVSHDKENLALKVGATYQLQLTHEQVRLREK